MQHLLQQIQSHRLVPVVAIESAADALPLADALAQGGLPVAEITFRTGAAEDAIAAMARRDHMLIGAGTVLNIGTAKRAVDAGAKFIVTPGFSPRIVQWCLDHAIPIIPGASTATDLQLASEFDLPVVKFFPAETAGGLKMLKVLAAPFSSIKFMPTGGIGPANLRAYLDFAQVLACGGSWMVKGELIAAKQFNKITALTAEAVALARGTAGK